MALSDCSKQVKWFRNLFNELGYDAFTIPIHIDNAAAEHLANNPVHGNLTKHIDLRAHDIREAVDAGFIRLQHVSSKDNVADSFTKNVGLPILQFSCQNSGLVRCEHTS